jgi:non-ribosomal peptide synthetase component E (peptide arylation enzyme)
MHQLLMDGAAREPDKVALRRIDRSKTLTYAQSVEATAHFAGALHHLGIRAGSQRSSDAKHPPIVIFRRLPQQSYSPLSS